MPIRRKLRKSRSRVAKDSENDFEITAGDIPSDLEFDEPIY